MTWGHKVTKSKVFVGLSGGVDSSVATALLKQQNYDVTGVFIKIWQEKWGPCNWKDDRRDAMRVAMHLGIPFKELDLSDEYEKAVVKYMIREYKAGRTPNPDVMCNSQIKFGEFLKWARQQGASFIATGHYARVTRNAQRITSLLSGVDENKDQSYFLWQLKQNQLKHCLFPIGEFQKSKVRKLAKKFKLPTAEKKDSQGICFIGKMGMKDFLKKYIKEKKGDVLNLDGKIIGHHDGAVFLTIGQRHGFVIIKKGTDDKPYYVVSKDVKKNTITVSSRKGHGIALPTARNDIIINKVNWINDKPVENKKYQARFRHLQKLQNCKISRLDSARQVILSKGEYKIKFTKPQEGIAPGQSLVLYDGEVCLGGGVIK